MVAGGGLLYQATSLSLCVCLSACAPTGYGVAAWGRWPALVWWRAVAGMSAFFKFLHFLCHASKLTHDKERDFLFFLSFCVYFTVR
jgi:hypothetical protein